MSSLDWKLRKEYLLDFIYDHLGKVIAATIMLSIVCGAGIGFVIFNFITSPKIEARLAKAEQLVNQAETLQERAERIRGQQHPVGEKEEKALQAMSDGLIEEFVGVGPVKVLMVQEAPWVDPRAIGAFVPPNNPNNKWNEPVIIMKSDLVQYVSFHRIMNTLKHELIHYWFYQYALLNDQALHGGHPRVFIEKAHSLGMDLDTITDEIPQEYREAVLADIEQNGYKYLPKVDEIVKYSEQLFNKYGHEKIPKQEVERMNQKIFQIRGELSSN